MQLMPELDDPMLTNIARTVGSRTHAGGGMRRRGGRVDPQHHDRVRWSEPISAVSHRRGIEVSSRSFTARPGSPEAAALIADLVRSGDLIPGRRSSADFVLVSKLRRLSMT